MKNSDNVIDSRDIEERIEELEGQQTPRYVAGWNMPGYMPDNEPAEFDDADDALEYIKDAAKYGLEAEDDDGILDADVDAWQVDNNGEFGQTFGKFHYWITQDGVMGLDKVEAEELATLIAFRDEASQYSPDWRYGATLIHENYFTDYCRELVSDIGDLPRNIPDYIEIDWQATADNIRADYTAVDFNGDTYYVR